MLMELAGGEDREVGEELNARMAAFPHRRRTCRAEKRTREPWFCTNKLTDAARWLCARVDWGLGKWTSKPVVWRLTGGCAPPNLLVGSWLFVMFVFAVVGR